jgi:hypothetical protein
MLLNFFKPISPEARAGAYFYRPQANLAPDPLMLPPSQTQMIKDLIFEMYDALSDSMKFKGRLRKDWRERVIDNTNHIASLCERILAIWPEKYDTHAGTIIIPVDEHGFPKLGNDNPDDINKVGITNPVKKYPSVEENLEISDLEESDNDIPDAEVCTEELVSTANLLYKFTRRHKNRYSDKAIKRYISNMEESLLNLKCHYDQDYCDATSSSSRCPMPPRDAQSLNGQGAQDESPLAHAFGMNFCASREKERKSYNSGNLQESGLTFIKPNYSEPVTGSTPYSETQRKEGSAFFG